MNKSLSVTILFFLGLSLVLGSCFRRQTESVETTAVATYEQGVASIIKKNCYYCHQGKKSKAGVRLDSYNLLKKFTSEGALLQRINDRKDPMPPKGLMSESDRTRIKNWADNGYK